MKLKYKNAKINYNVKKTDDKVGLASNDYWLLVDFYVETDDFTYHSCRKSLSLGEIVEACQNIRNAYDGPYPNHSIISFIKNYFKIYVRNTVNKRQMILELVNLEDLKRPSYKVYFENEEVLDFVSLSRNIS